MMQNDSGVPSPLNQKSPELSKVYIKLGHLMDALWFLEAEKQFGFDKAYEMDENVWRVYPKLEARRLKQYLGITTTSLSDIQDILELSLFNQTLEFTLNISHEPSSRILMQITGCKTLTGMEKAGRTPAQIHKICEGIGLAFFQTLLREFDQDVSVRCINCPHSPLSSKSMENSEEVPIDILCQWEFLLPNILP